MARAHPPDIAGATYHVMNRGNRKHRIFEDDRDRKRFVQLFIEAQQHYDVEVLIGQQMTNHFHAVVTTPHANLSEFMRQFQGDFARYSNWRHGRVGHLFQGRFKRVMIESDIHLFIAAAYVFDNPVVAGLVRRPEEWRWSSYAATVGMKPAPSYLSLSWVETLFPSESLSDSQQHLRRCMADPDRIFSYIQHVDPDDEVAIRSYFARRQVVGQPCTYRTLIRPPLEQLFGRYQTKCEREKTIQISHETHGYKLSEIARCIGLAPGTVSKIYRRSRRQ
jgi:putative transposase